MFSFSDVKYRTNMLKLLKKKQRIFYVADCAMLALPVWENKHLKDSRLRDALECKIQLLFAKGEEKKVFKEKLSNLSSVSYMAFFDSLSDNSDSPQYLAASLVWAVSSINIDYTTTVAANLTENAGNALNDWNSVSKLYFQALNESLSFSEDYKTKDAIGLSREIDATRDFTLMPVLADALIDAGCPEYNVRVVREGTGLSNWALYHLRNTKSR